MKSSHLFLSLLVLALISSCSQFNTDAKAKNAKVKAKVKADSPIDLNAKSGPMNGYNYYHLPQPPKMEKKGQAAKNVKPSKKPTTKK